MQKQVAQAIDDSTKLFEICLANFGGEFWPGEALCSGLTTLVLDSTGKHFFIANMENVPKGKIYPVSAIIKHASGSAFVGQHQKFYLDITVNDLANPTWRLWFGGDSARLSRASAGIDVAQHRLAA